jgi:hypothetical protein
MIELARAAASPGDAPIVQHVSAWGLPSLTLSGVHSYSGESFEQPFIGSNIAGNRGSPNR